VINSNLGPISHRY